MQAIGGGRYYIHTNITEKVDDEGNAYYEADTVVVSVLTYEAIVEALIRERYSVAAEIALINNFLDTEGQTAESVAEYQAYQDYRHAAKSAAREALGI